MTALCFIWRAAAAVAVGAALSVGAVRAGVRRARGISDGSENRPLIHFKTCPRDLKPRGASPERLYLLICSDEIEIQGRIEGVTETIFAKLLIAVYGQISLRSAILFKEHG